MTQLTKDDRALLISYEAIIEDGLQSFVEVGNALMRIRDKRLYLEKFATFDEYCRERWNIPRNRADEFIKEAKAVKQVELDRNLGEEPPILPKNESQARELSRVPAAQQSAAWNEVIETAPRDEQDKPIITGAHVREVVAKHVPPPEITAKTKAQYFTLEEWENLPESERKSRDSDSQFNKQDNTSIEWAQWSWNPITGCKHDCPYCYARDIAKRFYPQGFEPSIHPGRFSAPSNTKVPDKAKEDISYGNVFTCSMADLFGRWVPAEWIDRVMKAVDENEQWNFLFLTKFPNRFAEVKNIPANAWLGTTVDCQARVANAEKSFAKVKTGIKWLSVEPMLTPLKFKNLEVFNWIVIGGSSRSEQTPAWTPPFDWVADLHAQARKAGCAIYHKDNLGFSEEMRLKEFPWGADKPQKQLPDEFKYLAMEGK